MVLGVEPVAYVVTDASDRGMDARDPDVAASDAGVSAACDRGTWCDCQPAHTLCIDFDRSLGVVVAAGRAYAFDTNGIADAGLDDAQALSLPNSLRANAEIALNGAGATAGVMNLLATSERAVRLKFDVHIDHAPRGAAGLAEFNFRGAGCESVCVLSILLDVDKRELALYESCYNSEAGDVVVGHALRAMLDSNASWTHVTLLVSTAGGRALFGATVGGIPALDAGASDAFCGLPGEFYLGVNNLRGSEGTPWEAHFDNVALDLGP